VRTSSPPAQKNSEARKNPHIKQCGASSHEINKDSRDRMEASPPPRQPRHENTYLVAPQEGISRAGVNLRCPGTPPNVLSPPKSSDQSAPCITRDLPDGASTRPGETVRSFHLFKSEHGIRPEETGNSGLVNCQKLTRTVTRWTDDKDMDPPREVTRFRPLVGDVTGTAARKSGAEEQNEDTESQTPVNGRLTQDRRNDDTYILDISSVANQAVRKSDFQHSHSAR
jgi:hypothetical protein